MHAYFVDERGNETLVDAAFIIQPHRCDTCQCHGATAKCQNAAHRKWIVFLRIQIVNGDNIRWNEAVFKRGVAGYISILLSIIVLDCHREAGSQLDVRCVLCSQCRWFQIDEMWYCTLPCNRCLSIMDCLSLHSTAPVSVDFLKSAFEPVVHTRVWYQNIPL